MTSSNSISSLQASFLAESQQSPSKHHANSQTADSLSLPKFLTLPLSLPRHPSPASSLLLQSNNYISMLTKEEKLPTTPAPPKVFDIRVGLALTTPEPQSQSLRKQFEHLLPPHLSARISKPHLTLLNISQKIDNYLTFQKEMRGKSTVSFGELCKNINESHFVNLGVGHLRQILYLDEVFYKWRVEKKKSSYDVRLETVLRGDDGKGRRRNQLRRKVFEFLEGKYEVYLKEKGVERKEGVEGYWDRGFSVEVPVPMISLPWEKEEMEKAEQEGRGKLKQGGEKDKILDKQKLPNQQQLNPNPTLKKTPLNPEKPQLLTSFPSLVSKKQASFKQFFQKPKTGDQTFRQKLYRLVAQKQAKQKSLSLALQIKKQTQSSNQNILQRISKPTYLSIIDEINMIYISKNVNNVFLVNLLQQLDKRMEIGKEDLEEVVKDIMSFGTYLSEIQTKNGLIAKVDRNRYKEFKGEIEKIKIEE